ncbi:MAG: carboxypeptidase-like regulatory domain-containing protein [Muribaculaceae bacterium]|nr:carboxypeptidase-like regulatory domain-containing protein [Muribaculaceae bacterium]
MGKKLILFIFVVAAVVATAWGDGVADFAYPRKVSAEALTQLDKALKKGDGNAVVDAMIRYSIAQSSISKQSIDTILPRIEQLTVKEKRADIKALLYHLEAKVLRQYYAKYGAPRQVVDTVPARYELWSRSQINGKINELVRLSVKDEKPLLAKSLSNYSGLISEDPQGVFPSLYHFLALEGYEMTSNDEILTRLIANCEPGSDVHFEVIRRSLNSPVHIKKTNATSRSYVAMSYVEKYIDKEGVGVLLSFLDMSDKAISLCEDYVSRFPNSRYTPTATNIINKARAKDVTLSTWNECSTHDSIEVMIRAKNIDTLTVALYRVNDDYDYSKSNYYRTSDLTLVDKKEDIIIKNNEGKDYMLVYFPPLTYGRYILVPTYKNDYGINVNYDFITASPRKFLVHDLMLMSFINREARVKEFIAVDMTTGAPVEGATVSNKDWSGVTDRDGIAVHNDFSGKNHEYYVTKGDDKWNRDFYVYFFKSEDGTVLGANIYTDLAIYRPGEKVNFVGVVYSFSKEHRKLLANEDVRFELYDANDQLLDSLSLTTDSWGRASGTFSLPQDKMNGTFRIRLLVDDEFVGHKNIEVSEYKVPTFSLLLDKPRRYNLGEDVEISGKVTSYSGMPVVEAKVHIEVESPVWHDEDEVEMPDTIVTTDATGRFVLVIPADLIIQDTKDEDKEDFYNNEIVRYRYHLEVTNDQGETHADQDMVEIVLKETSTKVRANDARLLLDGKPIDAPITVFGTKNDVVTVHYKIKDNNTGKEQYGGTLMSDNVKVDWNSVPSGLYEFEVWTDGDANHTTSELLLYRLSDKQCYLENESLWIMPGGSKVSKKGKGEVLIGTSVDESHIYYIATTRTRIVSRGWLHYKPGIHKFTINMPKGADESVTVHFYNVYHKYSFREDVRLEAVVPPSELNIRIESFRDRLIPGENEQWRFTVLDNKDKLQKGAFMLEMVDKAIYDLKYNAWYSRFSSWNTDVIDYQQQIIYFNLGQKTIGPSWHRPYLEEYSLKLPELNTYHRNWFTLTKGFQGQDMALTATKVESGDSTRYKVTGYVYSATDFEPVIGAPVREKGSISNGVATDFDGKFTITVPSVTSVILIRYVGFQDYEFKPSELPQVIVLEEDAQSLEEVVVAGYQNVDKRLYTGDVARSLEGRAAGVSVSTDDDAEMKRVTVGSATTIRVRGATSIYGTNRPLWVVDGVIIEDNVELDANALAGGDAKLLIASSLTGLNVDDINSFEVLKGDVATSIYGARAMAGVVVVNTKSKQFARDKMMSIVKAREPGVKTALWKPMLVTGDDGRVAVEFTAPENNSTWVVQAIAYNENLISGNFFGELITSRPLMVKPIAPRFLRHGDMVTLKAQVQNDDDKDATVDAVVEMFDVRTNAVLHTSNQLLTLSPKETRNVEVTWTVPDTLALVGMRVKAATERWGDGEQIVIPVLEAASPVIETQSFYIDPGKEMTMTVPSHHDKAHITLETCENPLWYAVMALPTVYSENDKVASCVAHSLYAQSVARELAHSSPEIANAIRSWHADTTVVSMLEQNPNLKIGDLMASPFVGAAQRETLRMRQLSNLLDSTKMDDEHKRLVKALGKLQQSDGGWTWFSYPGCESSLYTTMGVLELVGEQLMITEGDIDDDLDEMVERGVLYCDSVVSNKFSKGDKIDYLSYAYVRSMFPEVEMSKKNKAIHDRSIKEVVAKWKDRSLIDRAYAAIVLYRSGKKDDARKIVQSLREFAVSDQQGMHWDNLQEGNAAFYDKVTLTATVLEALALVDPREDEISQVHKWMLLMKQSNDWGSSSLAAHAIYALLTTDGGNTWLTDSLGYSVREITSGETISFAKKTHPQWGAIYSAYNAQMADVKAFHTDDLSVTKNFMRYDKDGKLEPFTTLNVGDKIQVRITLDARKDLDYITVTDERAACFEPVDKISGYKWGEGVFYYNEVKDSKTNLFVTSLRKGVHTITYDVMVTNIGTFASGIASAQCQYSPQVTAHTAATVIEVK